MLWFYVRVVEAKGLPSADLNGKSDPYVKLSAGKACSRKTSVKKKTLDPVWSDPPFEMTCAKPSETRLQLKVFDKDFLKKDDFLGMCAFPVQGMLADLPRDKDVDVWLPLGKGEIPDGAKYGYLHFIVRAADFGASGVSSSGTAGVQGVQDGESGNKQLQPPPNVPLRPTLQPVQQSDQYLRTSGSRLFSDGSGPAPASVQRIGSSGGGILPASGPSKHVLLSGHYPPTLPSNSRSSSPSVQYGSMQTPVTSGQSLSGQYGSMQHPILSSQGAASRHNPSVESQLSSGQSTPPSNVLCDSVQSGPSFRRSATPLNGQDGMMQSISSGPTVLPPESHYGSVQGLMSSGQSTPPSNGRCGSVRSGPSFGRSATPPSGQYGIMQPISSGPTIVPLEAHYGSVQGLMSSGQTAPPNGQSGAMQPIFGQTIVPPEAHYGSVQNLMSPWQSTLPSDGKYGVMPSPGPSMPPSTGQCGFKQNGRPSEHCTPPPNGNYGAMPPIESGLIIPPPDAHYDATQCQLSASGQSTLPLPNGKYTMLPPTILSAQSTPASKKDNCSVQSKLSSSTPSGHYSPMLPPTIASGQSTPQSTVSPYGSMQHPISSGHNTAAASNRQYGSVDPQSSVKGSVAAPQRQWSGDSRAAPSQLRPATGQFGGVQPSGQYGRFQQPQTNQH